MKLRIPPVAPQLDPSVETRGVYVEEWIEALPYANPQNLLQSLYGALYALNRNPVKPAVRTSLLEHYLAPYCFLLDLRRKAAPPQGGGAIDRHRQEAVALSTLARELAIGYMRALADALSRNTLFGRGGELAMTTQRACALLACSLVHQWDAYLPAPEDAWGELHTLYLFAHARGTEQRRGAPDHARREFATDTGASYKRALLCALADPYRLPHGEIWRVFDVLGEHADRAVFGPMREVERKAGLFVVAPGALSRPVLALARLETEAPPDALLLDTNPLVAELQTRLEALRSKAVTGDEGADIATLGRLIRALGVPPRRHSPRRPEAGEVNLVAGLSAIHNVLGGAATAEFAVPVPAEGEVVVEEGDDATHDADADQHHYAADPWALNDRGSGGVGVKRDGRPRALPAVGELTGVQFSETDPRPWTVGVLRWLNLNLDDSYRAGVQLLGEAATPALVEVRGNGQAIPRPALLLSRAGDEGGRTLLVPGGIYRRNGELTLHAEGERLHVRMDRLIDASPLFDRLSFQDSEAT